MTNYLLPDVDTPLVSNGNVYRGDEAKVAALQPRVDSTGSCTLGGTIANGDVINLIFTASFLPNGSISVPTTAVTSDTATLLAERMAQALMASAALKPYGVIATADPVAGKVALTWPGPLGPSVVLSSTTSGAETRTLVQFTGGSGPIIPTDDYCFVYNGQIIRLVKGRRKLLSAQALAALMSCRTPPIS